ncbi:unnamed protein product [Calicophoron daubneyi]|uniref:L-aminoadipate-semialdehyde dehydrogenase-phosphopantetheinyl transferase n=1 Tax=Calicophoron daubneyi TaxID=300641 RepID=A0AAV2TZ36_CALDB
MFLPAMIRRAFCHGWWIPSKSELLFALSRLPAMEHAEVLRFAFQRDILSSLIGKLLVRHILSAEFNISSSDVLIGRTHFGKPFLSKPHTHMDFNISHGGQYTVVAAVPLGYCGVDVMQIELPPHEKSASSFVRKLSKIFTESELEAILSPESEYEKMHQFYRHWCLKEAYVKALGCGLRIPLSSLHCTLGTPTRLNPFCKSEHTVSENWFFEEHELPRNHVAAIAWRLDDSKPHAPYAPFTELDFAQLTSGLVQLSSATGDCWSSFSGKPRMPPSARQSPSTKRTVPEGFT